MDIERDSKGIKREALCEILASADDEYFSQKSIKK